MIIVIIKLIFITSLFIWGVKISTEPGMIFDKVGEWGEKKVQAGYKIFEALLVCPFCMPSIYSLFGYGFGYLLGIVTEWKQLIAYPIVVCGSSLVAGIVWMLFLLIIKVNKYFDFLNSEKD